VLSAADLCSGLRGDGCSWCGVPRAPLKSRRESCNNGLKPRARSVLLSCQPVVLETELVGFVECLMPGEGVEFAAAGSWGMRFEAPWTVDHVDSGIAQECHAALEGRV
jgi:hypothetical protein